MDNTNIELSIVIPCLDEHETIGVCVRKAQECLRAEGIVGEVVVADNGSTDGSIEIAEREGARVVPVSCRGYGNALMGGISAARGRYVIMGDADNSYDFHEIPKFLGKLREGYSLVQGCRLPAGGGHVMPKAMPLLHRWIGNPMFSWQVREMFGAPIHDVYCGMRGFTKEMYERLRMRCTGMEFATEMIIKASLFGESIAEVPITLWPDGRRLRRPHLRTFRDGWRTLRFFMICSPRWLFWYPGLWLIALGIVGYALAMPGFAIFGAVLDAHTLLFSTLSIMVGLQSCIFAVASTTYAINEGLRPMSPRLERFFRVFRLEQGLLLGMFASAIGMCLLLAAVLQWWQVDFGPLDYTRTMRLVIPGVALVATGTQAILGSFLCSILSLKLN